LTDFLGDSRTSEFVNSLVDGFSRLDRLFGLGKQVFQVRSYLLRSWISINKSILKSSGSTFDSYLSRMISSAFDIICNKFETVTEKLRNYLLHNSVTREYFESAGVFVRRANNVKSNSPDDSNPANDPEIIQSNLLLAIIQQFMLLACTVLFMALWRFRTHRQRRFIAEREQNLGNQRNG
jgi:hypothetical protein